MVFIGDYCLKESGGILVYRNQSINRWLVVGIIFFSLDMSGVLNTSGRTIPDELSTMMKVYLDGIELHGWMGDNGWYRSDVQIILNYTTSGIYIFYKLDEGEWSEYTVPIIVSTDGTHTVWCYYIDAQGNQSETYSTSFKIDQTPPNIMLHSEVIDRYTYRITADASDTSSGINRVEFFMNDCLIENDSTAPYEWIYKGPSFDLAALAFDNAGNTALEVTPGSPIRFFAIGFIENVSFSPYNVYFYAKFILFFEGHSFTTLTNQQMMIYTSYTGYIGENFMMIKYSHLF
jgi:hypothetical protein